VTSISSSRNDVSKLRFINEQLSVEEFILVFDYGSMPIETAGASMRLFAVEALPEVKSAKLSPLSSGNLRRKLCLSLGRQPPDDRAAPVDQRRPTS
jgi:hypothetical protein